MNEGHIAQILLLWISVSWLTRWTLLGPTVTDKLINRKREHEYRGWLHQTARHEMPNLESLPLALVNFQWFCPSHSYRLGDFFYQEQAFNPALPGCQNAQCKEQGRIFTPKRVVTFPKSCVHYVLLKQVFLQKLSPKEDLLSPELIWKNFGTLLGIKDFRVSG